MKTYESLNNLNKNKLLSLFDNHISSTKKLQIISTKTKELFCLSETIIVFLFKKLNLYLQYLFFRFWIKSFFVIFSQNSIEKNIY